MIAMSLDKLNGEKKANFAIQLENKDKLVTLENEVEKLKKNMNKRKNSGQTQAESNLKVEISEDSSK